MKISKGFSNQMKDMTRYEFEEVKKPKKEL
jgi:hypothetical protein